MFAPLVFAVAVLTAPTDAESIGSRYASCPDGSIMEFAMYDPDPNDPNAVIVLYKRGPLVIAKLDSRNMTLTLASGQVLDIVTAKERFATPCDIPQGV